MKTDELIDNLKTVLISAESLEKENEELNQLLKTRRDSLDVAVQNNKDLEDNLKEKLVAVEAREKVCDDADAVQAKHDAAVEKERAIKALHAEYDAKLKVHDQRMKDENATNEAAKERQKNAELALEKEKEEYKDKLKKESLKGLLAQMVD